MYILFSRYFDENQFQAYLLHFLIYFSVNQKKISPNELKKHGIKINQDGKKIATGSTIIAFLDSDSRKPIRCPKEISEKISGV